MNNRELVAARQKLYYTSLYGGGPRPDKDGCIDFRTAEGYLYRVPMDLYEASILQEVQALLEDHPSLNVGQAHGLATMKYCYGGFSVGDPGVLWQDKWIS